MLKSKEIEKELSQTTNRLNELTEMRENLQSNLVNLQTKFIDGKISLDEIQSEQGKINTLASSIEALAKRQADAERRFDNAKVLEYQENLLQQAKSVAAESEKLHDEYFAIRNEFHTLILKTAEKLTAKLTEFRSKQREFRDIGSGIDSNFSKIATIEGNAAQKSVKSMLSEKGASDRALNLSTVASLNYSEMEYGQAVAIAENTAANKVFRMERAEHQANLETERRANRERLEAERKFAADTRKKAVADISEQIRSYRKSSNMPALPEEQVLRIAYESIDTGQSFKRIHA